MKCLRCGYCCLYLWIIVIKDPTKPISEDNCQEVDARQGKPCPHLRGNKPGEYSCVIHNFHRYKKTPCFSHGQIERSKKDLCRMGNYIINSRPLRLSSKLGRASGES